jgi:hypothetical protein
MATSGDIEVVVEQTDGHNGGYMGIYHSKTRDSIGLHYQYYMGTSLLKAQSSFRTDISYGPTYYYEGGSILLHCTWYNEGEPVKRIYRMVSGTYFIKSLSF